MGRLQGKEAITTFWVKPALGEFECGVFKDATDKKNPDRLFLAKHNADTSQDAAMKLNKPRKLFVFSTKDAKWVALESKDGTVSFTLATGGGVLLKAE